MSMATARRWLGRALVLGALSGWTYWNLSRDERLAEAADYEVRGERNQALWAQSARLALDYLTFHPWSREAAVRAGRSLSGLNHSELAEGYYRRAGLDSLTTEDLHVRAYGIIRANRREAAIEAYGAILERDPNDVLALRRLGAVLISRARYADALAVADRLIGLPGGEGRVLGWTLAGTCHHNNRDYEAAMAAWDEVLAADPDLREMPLPEEQFWAYAAFDALEMGRSRDVIRWLTPLVESRYRDRPGLLDLIGQANYQLGEFDAAEAAWRKALAGAPDFAMTHTRLGRLLLFQDRVEEAVVYLKRSIELAPSVPTTYYSLGLAYRKLGREAEARAEMERFQRVKNAAAPKIPTEMPGPARAGDGGLVEGNRG